VCEDFIGICGSRDQARKIGEERREERKKRQYTDLASAMMTGYTIQEATWNELWDCPCGEIHLCTGSIPLGQRLATASRPGCTGRTV